MIPGAARYRLTAIIAGLAVVIAFATFEASFYAAHSVWRDPDTLMRLAIARGMQADGWQRPVMFMRENAPFGMALHWSSLFFWAMLAAARLIWWMPQVQALDAIGVITGPVIAVMCFGAAYWTARPLLRQWLALCFGLSIVFCPAFFGYSRAGTANHHPLMILMALILLGVAIRADLGIARIRHLSMAGITAGLGLWVSFEAMPFIEVFWLYMFVLWMCNGISIRLMQFGIAFCAVTLTGLLIDPPYGGYASVELDRLSLPYVFGIALQLGCALLCRWMSPSTSLRRVGLAGVLAAFAIAIELAVFPMVAGGPVGQFNPFLKSQWMPTIAEMRPIQSTDDMLLLLGNGVIGIATLMWAPVRPQWKSNLYLCGLIGLGFLTCRYIRFSPYLWTAGSLVAFHALDRVRMAAGIGNRLLPPIVAMYLIFGNLMLAGPIQWDPQKMMRNGPMNCAIPPVLAALEDRSFLNARDAAPIFVTSLDQSPELLYYTPYRTLAGNYHSDPQGINDSYLLMRDFGWDTAHSVVQDHGIEFLLMCPSLDRARYGTTDVQRYARLSTQGHELRQPTFYTRIMDGTLPPWLVQRQWPDGVKSDLKLFQVVEPPASP